MDIYIFKKQPKQNLNYIVTVDNSFLLTVMRLKNIYMVEVCKHFAGRRAQIEEKKSSPL